MRSVAGWEQRAGELTLEPGHAHDEAGIKPKHSTAETLKLCVAALVGAPPSRVIPAIHFDDEANTGRDEIDDEAMGKWHLPAELQPEFAAREPPRGELQNR